MLWRERRRRLASARANLAFSKEERDFAGSGFYRVGTVGAVLGEAVSVVIRTPEQAKEHIDGQNRVPKPKHERIDCAASVPAAHYGAHAQHEKDEKAQRREDVQTFRDGEGHALAELSDRAPQRIREALRQGVHSASAAPRKQKGR